MSPSQASETCASASSATSARCQVGHYANACGGCQECLSPVTPFVVLPVTIPKSITIPISISTTTDAIVVAVTIPAVTSVDVCVSRTPIGSPPLPTTGTRVLTVNKLLAILLPMRTSPPTATALRHRVRGSAEENHQTHY